jgi:hypothetical protein
MMLTATDTARRHRLIGELSDERRRARSFA